VDSPVHVLLDRFQAEKIEGELRKSIAFVARVQSAEGEGKIFFFLLSWIRKEKKLEGPQTRDDERDKKRRRKKKFELALELWRVFVGNEREEEKEKINRKWRPTGPRRRAKAGNGGRGKATRTFLSGKS
jgi:hypothetical protein